MCIWPSQQSCSPAQGSMSLVCMGRPTLSLQASSSALFNMESSERKVQSLCFFVIIVFPHKRWGWGGLSVHQWSYLAFFIQPKLRLMFVKIIRWFSLNVFMWWAGLLLFEKQRTPSAKFLSLDQLCLSSKIILLKALTQDLKEDVFLV